MAMIKCPECGQEISEKAKKCIHCGKVFIEDKPKTKICSECGKEVPIDATECSFCGCPLDDESVDLQDSKIKDNKPNPKSKMKVIKIVTPVAIVVIAAIIGIVIYSVKVIKPKNTYNEAVMLLEKGKYEEANELFDTITGYRDVDTIQEQLKYESYAYSAINSLKKYLKNPDSYQPYEIIFYASMGTEEADIEKYPVCIMHYGAQNGFGGNTTSYAIFAYSTEKAMSFS